MKVSGDVRAVGVVSFSLHGLKKAYSWARVTGRMVA